MPIRSLKYLLLVLFVYQLDNICAQSDQQETPEDSVKSKNGTFLELPIITFSPETSLQLGAISIYFFRFNNAPEGTQLSTIKLPINYTLNNQAKIRLSYEIFFNENKHIFKGLTQWIRFPLLFYGLGNQAPEQNEEIYTTRTITFDVNYLARVQSNIFLGARFNRQDSRIVEAEEDGLLMQEGLIPGNEGGVISGAGLIARFDRRDNNFNATTGPFLEGVLTAYRSGLGSDFDFTKLQLDLRHYFQTFQNRHVIAFNLIAERNWGNPPFEAMALLGGEQIMRGHYEGRFRERALMAAQMEYRIPLGRSSWIDERDKIPFWQRWGLAGFVGVGNVAPEASQLGFDEVKSSLGIGLRYLVKPKERVNIRVDFGFGSQNPAFYLNIRESF